MVEIGEIDVDSDAPDDRERIGRDPAAALSWLLDPIGGMWPLLEAGAASVQRILGITWSPVETAVNQVFARSRRAAAAG